MKKEGFNKIIWVLLCILINISCDKKSNLPTTTFFRECDYLEEIKAPKGHEIEIISELDFNGTVQQFQFIGKMLGYALVSNNVGGYVELFKTLNGGTTWENLNININHSPINMVFKDDRIGFITVLDGNEKSILLKTEDGGVNWKELEYPKLRGYLYHPQHNNEGNLYSILSINDNAKLVRSKDNAETWEEFYNSPELGFSLVTFSFKLGVDKIYISGKEGKIIVIDYSGKLIDSIDIGDYPIWDLEIIDKDNIIVVLSGKVIKTLDGGKTWDEIYHSSSRMIGFENENDGFMFLQRSSCVDSDVYHVNDVIASTSNGGLIWNEANEQTTNMAARYSNSQKIDDQRWFFMIRNKLLEIKKE